MAGTTTREGLAPGYSGTRGRQRDDAGERCYPGGCFACKGRGYFLTTKATIARRQAREDEANAKAATVRAASGKVTEILLAAWGDEFAHIDEDYRHMHVTQKASRILYQQHGLSINCPADMARHFDKLGIAA